MGEFVRSAAHVVVVDDDDDTAMLLAQLLATRGFTASALPTRRRASTASRAAMSTWSSSTSSSATSRGSRYVGSFVEYIPASVLLMTGQLRAVQADEANAAGAFDYLTKPIAIDALD